MILDHCRQNSNVMRSVRPDDSEFGEMATNGVYELSALTYQKLSNAMYHEDFLLLLLLDRHKPHGGARHRFANRFSIRRIILIRFDIWANELGRQKLHIVTTFSQSAGPIMGAGASFQTYAAWRQFRKNGSTWSLRRRFSKQFSAITARRMHLKNILRDVESNQRNIVVHGKPLAVDPSTLPLRLPKGERGHPCHHVRRKFYERHIAGSSKLATTTIERMAPSVGRSRTACEASIQTHVSRPARKPSVAVVADLFKLWQDALPRISGKSKLAEAIRYAVSRRVPPRTLPLRWPHRDRLQHCGTRHPPQTITRKNSLFADSDGGGRTWATIALNAISVCRSSSSPVEKLSGLQHCMHRHRPVFGRAQLQLA